MRPRQRESILEGRREMTKWRSSRGRVINDGISSVVDIVVVDLFIVCCWGVSEWLDGFRT